MLRSFNTDDWHHVQVFLQELHVRRADERTIGEDGEDHVFHLCHLLQNVPTHHGFTTCQEREVDTQVGSDGTGAVSLIF